MWNLLPHPAVQDPQRPRLGDGRGLRPATARLQERELESLRDGVNRLKDLFVMDDVTKAEYKTRLERLKDLIVRRENEYEQSKESLDGCSLLTHAKRLQLI